MNKAQITRFVLYIAGIVAIVIVVYIAVFSVRVVSGVSQNEITPETLVRVRVLDAGVTDVQAVVNKLKTIPATDIAVHIVETGTFDLHSVHRSFVISHTEDKSAAVQLAKQLDLDPSYVIYKPLEHNTKQITATLVAGKDMDSVIANFQLKKE